MYSSASLWLLRTSRGYGLWYIHKCVAMQAASQNIIQDAFDPDRMTYEVGHVACMNCMLCFF